MSGEQLRAQKMLLLQIISIAADGSVADEIDLTSDQRVVISEIASEYRGIMQQALIDQQSSLANGKGNANGSELRRAKTKVAQRENEFVLEASKKLDEHLLPHQLKRLRQIALQYQLSLSEDKEPIFVIKKLLDRLEMTSDEREKAESSIDDAVSKYEKEYKKIRTELEADILRSLPDSAKDRLNELIGDLHKFKR
jgi:hypothetical protein